jgi:hypothetical protein
MGRPNRREKWKPKVQRTGTLPPAARLFLVGVLAPQMDANGFVSVPRRILAARAGVSERRVTRFITQAKEAGWLVVVQPGYRSMTAVYQATFPDVNSGNKVFPLSEPETGRESGNTRDPHCAGTECSPITPGKREQSVPTTSSSTTSTPVPNHRDPVPVRIGWNHIAGIYGEEFIADRSAPDLESLVASVGAPLLSARERHLQLVTA